MSSIHQLTTKAGNKIQRKKKIKKIRTRALKGAPYRLGTIFKVFEGAPKKPNSARRKMAKVTLNFSKKFIICHIPGEKHTLQKFSTVLIRGAYVRDIPGVNYRAINGKFDFSASYHRRSSRSKYGCKKVM